MSSKRYLDWNEDVYTWSEKDWDWKDVYLLIEESIGGLIGGGNFLDIDPLSPWESMERKLKNKKVPEEKISKLLEVIVSVKGEDKKFSKSVTKNTKITIEDIQKTLSKYGNGHIKVQAEIKK